MFIDSAYIEWYILFQKINYRSKVVLLQNYSLEVIMALKQTKKRAIEVLRSQMAKVQIKGADAHVEIVFPQTDSIDDALMELGILAFDEDDCLIVSGSRDVGILRTNKLLPDVKEVCSDCTEKKISSLNVPVTDEDFSLRLEGITNVYPRFTQAPKNVHVRQGVQQHDLEVLDVVDYLRFSEEEWRSGMSEICEEKPSEYTRLLNLQCFPVRYRWVGGKLYRVSSVSDLGEEITDVEYENLLKHAHQGDKRATSEVVCIHTGLVVSRVAKLREFLSGESDDMMQCGLIGLHHAVKHHDSIKGSFSSYAVKCIDGTILSHGRDSGLIRKPVARRKELRYYNEVSRSLEQQYARRVHKGELSDVLKMDLSDLDKFIRDMFIECEYYGLTYDEDDADRSLHVDVVNESELHFMSGDIYDLYESISRDKLNKYLERALLSLTVREARIIKLRFGIGLDSDGLTSENVGFYLDLTRVRIEQIESKALKKLRHNTRLAHLIGYMSSEIEAEVMLSLLKSNGRLAK